MATNDFLVFAGGSGANALDQASYNALAARLNGFQAGIAKSPELNKVWRQSSIMSAALAQLIADRTGADVLDDGTTATILANLKASAPKGTTLYDYGIFLATQAEAEAGADNTKPMTPLRTAQAIAKLANTAQLGTEVAKLQAEKVPFAAFFGASQSLAANGYQKLPGGLIIQWGTTASLASNTPTNVTLPMTFPNACLFAGGFGSDGANNSAYACNASPLSTSQIRLAQSYGLVISVRWIAIGH